MVGIDERLEGIKMCLRPSMNKFQALDKDVAPIEIARWFDKPGTSYLNRYVLFMHTLSIRGDGSAVRRSLVMILEDRGVDKEVFVKLQELAVNEVLTASDSIDGAVRLLKTHNIGLSFGLPLILNGLKAIGTGMEQEEDVTAGTLNQTFLYSLLGYAQAHILRDMKHSARIPIPDSYLLVGLADEGPAYEEAGFKNVYKLKKDQIFGTYFHNSLAA